MERERISYAASTVLMSAVLLPIFHSPDVIKSWGSFRDNLDDLRTKLLGNFRVLG
jgi:hypothetical protein